MAAGRKRAPRSVVERDFLDAIERLVSNKPLNPKLKRLVSEHRLEINPSTVSLEAKRSRTLIGYDGCQLQDIRKKVLDLKNPGEVATPRTAREVISRLRADIADLKVKLRGSMDAQAAHFLARQRAEREAQRWRVESNRRGDQLKKIGNVRLIDAVESDG